MKKIIFSSLILSLFFAPVVSAANLAIPFTLQAPHNNWVQPWADACEESVTVMVSEYYKSNPATRLTAATATLEMQKIINWENLEFGANKDTNAEQMAQIINTYLPWTATVVAYPTLYDIKSEIDAARPVIALAYGKGLKNPYFRAPGPTYHTVVIKGYDDATHEFITHEPGVGRGLDYRYGYDTLMDALHDFVPGGKTLTGTPVVLFTSLPALESGTLVKKANHPGVYFMEGSYKYPVASEHAFLTRGWKWSKIRTVDQSTLDRFVGGTAIK